MGTVGTGMLGAHCSKLRNLERRMARYERVETEPAD